MTIEETLSTLEVAEAEVEWEFPLDYAIAFQQAKLALQKQIPTKPKKVRVKINNEELEVGKCMCGEQVIHTMNYCDNCGIRLDWS